MADSKLRLQIVTALDAAGIKATQEQIDGLAKQIEKVDKDDKIKKLENAFGNMPGILGKFSKALGGVVGKAGMLVGAFTTGYQLGDMFFEKVQKGLLGWKDPLDQLKEANKKLKKQQEEEIKQWQYKANLITNYYQTEQTAIDKSIQKINAQAQSYTRLAKAASDFFTAGEDKDIQQLERERFEDITRLQALGEYDAADQANKIYDVLKQEMETKKQILAYDRETDQQEAAMLSKRQQAAQLLEKEKKLKEEQWTLQGWKDELDAGLSNAEIDKNQAQINARLKQIDRELQTLNKDANSLADDMDAYEIESATREVNRANLVDKLLLEGDKAALEYDKSIASNGNLLGIEFTKDFMEQFNQASIDSYNELKAIEVNTQGLQALSEKMDALLQIKQ